MNLWKLHKILGWLLLLPLLAWSITGAIFIIKPGYDEAFAQLSPKFYPLEQALQLPANPNWQQVKYQRSILGYHLLVKQHDQWQQRDLKQFKPLPPPAPEKIQLLLNDSLPQHNLRYGQLVLNPDGSFSTTTGVTVDFDWHSMQIKQQGHDTQLIRLMYKIHYLQWLGNKPLNSLFAIVGLIGLVLLCYCGIRIALNHSNKRKLS